MTRSTLSLAAYTFAHFAVDFACFFMLFAGFARKYPNLATVALGFLIYNVLAFGLQPIIGYCCDQNKAIPIALIGCLLLLSGLLLLSIPWLALVTGALGNACFHIGGGIDSLLNAAGKMSRSGIFVSTGAIGVALGSLAGKSGLLGVWLPLVLVGGSAAALALICPLPSRRIAAAESRFQTATTLRPLEIVLLLCVISIAVRSYVGSIIPLAWRTTSFLILLPAIGAGCGKSLGGFLADWFGARRTGVASLLLALPFLVFGNSHPALCVTGILLFNISMSITLGAIFSTLPANPGLSFGLTTLGLLGGNLPVFFSVLPQNARLIVIAILVIVSAACLYQAATNFNGGLRHDKPTENE